MNILGIFMEGPNTGAAIFRDGVVLAAAEEERFLRQKGASEVFPSQSIRFCVREAKLALDDIDTVAVGWDHSKYPDFMDRQMRSLPGRERDPLADTVESIIHHKLSLEVANLTIETGLARLGRKKPAKIAYYGHHLCHAASVHYLSGFDRSGILVLDGSGEELATTTWAGEGDDIRPVEQWKLPDSLGWFYAALTEFLGFRAYSSEGKVMGLAPYGKADPGIRRLLERFCIRDAAHVYRVDPRFVYYGRRSHSRRFTDDLVELLGPPRLPDAPLTDRYRNIAFETQALLEDVAVRLAQRLNEKTGSDKLCVSGGVAMNCKMNGVLARQKFVRDIFIHPASHDSGTAIGAGLLAARDGGDNPRKQRLSHAYWGSSYSNEDVETILKQCHIPYRRIDDIASAAAALLADGKIVGWFQGRAELGARALGGRSILGNPLVPEMKDIINAKVKFREGFRPFAPSLVVEAMGKYMNNPKESPFMLLAYEFKPEYRKLLPAIVHVDGTVRPQTVSRDSNPVYWRLLDEFGKLTGHPVLLNTSFNVRGEPIVNSPHDAIRCFYSTGMDALAIGEYLIEK